MIAQNVDYSTIEEISDEGLFFFKVMMRLEFALKDIGYGSPGRRQAAEVNWVLYANKRLGSAFWQKIKGAAEVEALIHTPPKKQVIDKCGNLNWEESSVVSSVQELFGAITRVRNNLFHGGKSGDPDADRNSKLYLAALFVIDLALREDDHLRTSFTGHY